MHFGNIESVEIDSDERGLVLRIQSEEFGEIALDMTLDVAETLYDQARSRIEPWLRERDAAKVSYIFRCDPDESTGAYELSSPKHPRYFSTHTDVWDARSDK